MQKLQPTLTVTDRSDHINGSQSDVLNTLFYFNLLTTVANSILQQWQIQKIGGIANTINESQISQLFNHYFITPFISPLLNC